MKLRMMFLASMLAIFCVLAGCSSKEEATTGFSKVEVTPTESQIAADETVSSDVHTPMMWEQTLEFGSLIFTIDNVEQITNANDIGEGGFGEHSEVAFFNGEYYELASNNWKEYGNLYETIYLYPEYIDSTGTFMDGACMIALDITVESKDATNQQKNSNTGEIETRYGNPYIFKADSLLYLIDKDVLTPDGDYAGVPAGFFSGYNLRTEHPMAYELKPGEKTSFRIGFLIGNRPDGSDRVYSELAVSTQSNSLDDETVWFPLNLEDKS